MLETSNHKYYVGSKVPARNEQRNKDIVEFMEYIPDESTRGENHGRGVMIVIASRWSGVSMLYLNR